MSPVPLARLDLHSFALSAAHNCEHLQLRTFSPLLCTFSSTKLCTFGCFFLLTIVNFKFLTIVYFLPLTIVHIYCTSNCAVWPRHKSQAYENANIKLYASSGSYLKPNKNIKENFGKPSPTKTNEWLTIGFSLYPVHFNLFFTEASL